MYLPPTSPTPCATPRCRSQRSAKRPLNGVRDVTSARSVDVPAMFDHPGVGLFGRFTPRAQQAVINAERTAREVPHDYVGTEHVLLGLIDEGGNLGLTVLTRSRSNRTTCALNSSLRCRRQPSGSTVICASLR